MKIADIMRPDVDTAPPGLGLEGLVSAHLNRKSRLLYVVDASRKLLGLIGESELISLLAPRYLDSHLARAVTDDTALLRESFDVLRKKTASEVMNRDFLSVEPGDTFLSADVLLKEMGQIALPVLDENGILLGEISREDILRAIVKLCCFLEKDVS